MSSRLFKNFIRKAILERQPGPPPREGLQWKPSTHRWIRPKDGEPTPEQTSAPEQPSTPSADQVTFDNLWNAINDNMMESILDGDYDDALDRLGLDSEDEDISTFMAIGVSKYMGKEPSWGGSETGEVNQEAVNFFEAIARRHEDALDYYDYDEDEDEDYDDDD